MIGKILKAVADELSSYINNLDASFSANDIVLTNISQLEGGGNAGKIALSLVNLEQDTPLRNNPAYTAISETQLNRHNPHVVLNLYVLFSVLEGQDREAELDYLTWLIAAFQRKNVFTTADVRIANALNDINPVLQTEKIIFDQYSMTFEQLNHLWGMLGGKYLPSVLYKMRLICVFVDEGERGSVVESIERRESVIN